MFEPEVFRKQMHCIEESACNIVGIFRRPGNCASSLSPLVTPLPTPTPLQNILCLICVVETVCACALWTSNIESKKMQCTSGTDSLGTARDKLRGPLAHLLYLSLGTPGFSLAHCAIVGWPASDGFMVTGTSYMRHSQLFFKTKLWNEKVTKEPKSSQIGK